MEALSATGSLTTPSGTSSPYHEPLSPNDGDRSAGDIDSSPLVLPGTEEQAADMEVPELVLERPDGGKAKSL